MHDIGVAVIGTGFIGPVHAEALQRLRVNVIGVLGSSEEKSRQANWLFSEIADWGKILVETGFLALKNF